MSRIGNNIFSLLEGVECDPTKVIENANLVHKASPAPAPSKKEKIAQKAVSKNEAALDLQQHLLYPSQNRLRNLRRERQGNSNGYVSNGRRQESSRGSQEKDGELNNNHNINGGRYYEHRNGYQGGSRVGYSYNNQYRKNNNYKNGRGYNNSGQEEDCRNQLPEVVDQGSASNVRDDSWQEVGSRRNVHKQARVYNSGYRRRRYHNGWQNRENHSNKNDSESTERNDTNGVDGSEEAPAISAAADIDAGDLHGSEKAPLIDAAAADDIVDAKSEIGSATVDSTSEVTQGDGGANATGSEESAEKKSEGEENKNKNKKKKRNNKNKKNNNGDQFDKEKEAQSRVDDRKLMTLKEYEKLQLQKKEALEALKSGEARQVRVDKDLESMQLVEKKRKEESDASKKKEEAEKKKASRPVIKKKGIDEFVKPKTLAAGRPNGGGNYQLQDRRNYGDGERFNNQSWAGRGRGNYQHQQQRANYGDEKVFNGRRGSGSVRGRGNGGVKYNNSSSSAGSDGAAAATAGDVSAAGGGAKGGPEFAIDPKQFPELLREK
ncbi:unnamed protein product [Linum trigynum]|uniref:Uncharacterized protein n=1 Tax=Linum trigynum TaxID=586398 RepID=A0AAV2CYR1_9ROSI